jgi:hypothetical protein
MSKTSRWQNKGQSCMYSHFRFRLLTYHRILSSVGERFVPHLHQTFRLALTFTHLELIPGSNRKCSHCKSCNPRSRCHSRTRPKIRRSRRRLDFTQPWGANISGRCTQMRSGDSEPSGLYLRLLESFLRVMNFQ